MYAGEDAFSGMTLSRLLQAFPNVRLHDGRLLVDDVGDCFWHRIFPTLPHVSVLFFQTVEAFFCAAPLEWQDELASAVIRSLVEVR